MIREIEDAIISVIDSHEAELGVRKVGALDGDLKQVMNDLRLWPAILVGYQGGRDIPGTSDSYKVEKFFNVFLFVKSFRGDKGNLYDMIDSLRRMFSGVNLGLTFVDIVHPTEDEAISTDFNKTIWVLRLKIEGWR